MQLRALPQNMQMACFVQFSFDNNPPGKLLRKFIFNKSASCVPFNSTISYFFFLFFRWSAYSVCWVFNLHTNGTSCFNCWRERDTTFFFFCCCCCQTKLLWWCQALIRWQFMANSRQKFITRQYSQCALLRTPSQAMRCALSDTVDLSKFASGWLSNSYWIFLLRIDCNDGSSSSRAEGDSDTATPESCCAEKIFYRLWTRKSKE